MRETEVAREPAPVHEFAWFVVWVAAGAAISLGTIIFLILAVIPDLLLIALVWSFRRARRSMWGILTGSGLPLLYVAYIHREGPGETCVRTATRVHCQTHLDPLPWLAVGVVLLIAGVVGHALRSKPRNA